jgi:hypothetical protein
MAAVATTATRRPPAHERRPLDRRSAVRLPDRGRATLDDRITALWAQLVESGTGECPVCGSGIAAGVACASCGSELT